MARVAAGAWMRGASWGLKTYVRAGRRVTDAALHMENPLNLVEDAGREVIEGRASACSASPTSSAVSIPGPALRPSRRHCASAALPCSSARRSVEDDQ